MLLVSFSNRGEKVMTVQDELVRAGSQTSANDASDAPFWQDRSCEELRAIASRGVHGGDLYFAAVAELERRAHDCEVEIEHHQEEVAAYRQHQIWWLAVLIAALAIGAVARLAGY
jgi:hypothetical protein